MNLEIIEKGDKCIKCGKTELKSGNHAYGTCLDCLENKRIKWREKGNGLNAFNDKGEHLGSLKYEKVGRHFHFCWYQSSSIRMSPGCLQEVRDKQKELLKEKNEKTRNKD